MTPTTISMNQPGGQRRVIVGVDTHKDAHVAVALDELGGLLGSGTFTADRVGYRALIGWAAVFGDQIVFGVEGTGSYGAGLASAIRRSGNGVLEVLRADRRDRRLRGKSDTIDAENAARAVLAGIVHAVPKTGDGIVEMIRVTKVAKDNAVKARSSAMISLKQVLVNAPDDLRQSLKGLPRMTLIRRCAGLQAGRIDSVTAATENALHSIATRWLALDAEIRGHDHLLATLTSSVVPSLVEAFGIGPDVAAEMLIVLGDNPERIHSEAAFARLCGTNPIPASSGKTSRHRLNRGGHRQANAALYRTVVVRMQYHEPTMAYVTRRTAEGKTKPEIIRCLKRLLAREVWSLTRDFRRPALT